MHLQNPQILIALLIVPLIAALYIHAAIKRSQALKAFGISPKRISRKREACSTCAAVGLIIFALARPAWNHEKHALQETGRDVIFLLDVSRSMLAKDLHPNRLENAKTAILDCLENLTGDRVALVLFAGSAEIRCPLTADYDYFRMALRQANTQSAAAGGTQIAHALQRTTDKLINPDSNRNTDLILITDGDDLVPGPDEINAAKQLNTHHIRLIAIGLGDPIQGQRISIENPKTGEHTFLKKGNSEVWTKLHSETLQTMTASVNEGLYFDVAKGPFDLATIYRQIMENAPRTTTDKQIIDRYQEKFHHFLTAALLLLITAHRWRKK